MRFCNYKNNAIFGYSPSSFLQTSAYYEAMELQNARLLKTLAYIQGEWVAATSGRTFPVCNPYNGEALAEVPDMGAEETLSAIRAAHEAFLTWRHQSAGERAQLLKKWHALQLKYTEDLAHLLTLEQGKPLAEARAEVAYGASFVEWFAEEARRTRGDVIPAPDHNRRMLAMKQAVGVVAAITPWNFPNAMITRKVAPALAAGCTVVLKPAEDTPLSALALAELAQEAGFPPGIFNIITSKNPAPVGEELTRNPLVKKLSFTGSTKIGKLLMRQCSDTVKNISLELGGNAPFIVLEDADVESAVTGAMAAKYRNAGQTCICANRIYVHAKLADTFVKRLSEQSQNLKSGYGLEPGVEIGPMINKEAIQKVESLVAEALSQGAQVKTGGNIAGERNNFFQATVLHQVHANMRINREEIFGPVAPVYTFETEEEVIRLANDTPYGLAAYFYGQDIRRVWRVAEALDYGMVGVNTGRISSPLAPFGGVKESGIGREGGHYGIQEFMETKYICLGDMDA